jgi:hypothetical protein
MAVWQLAGREEEESIIEDWTAKMVKLEVVFVPVVVGSTDRKHEVCLRRLKCYLVRVVVERNYYIRVSPAILLSPTQGSPTVVDEQDLGLFSRLHGLMVVSALRR